MANSLLDHSVPDSREMVRAFERGPIGLVSSYVLAGGTLTGKYLAGASGRASDDDSPLMQRGKLLAADVAAIAADWGVPSAHVAFAHAFLHPHVASIVFGASSAEQLNENVAAWETFARLDAAQRESVRELATRQ
jgi:L-glyceraldehyde 3-phosphate reductase